MSRWIIIATFRLPHQAHLAKTRLEAEQIEVRLDDELTIQVHHFYSQALGGVKLLVDAKDCSRAKQILTEDGFLTSENTSKNYGWLWLDKITRKMPLTQKLAYEVRFVIFFAIVFSVLATLTACYFYFSEKN